MQTAERYCDCFPVFFLMILGLTGLCLDLRNLICYSLLPFQCIANYSKPLRLNNSQAQLLSTVVKSIIAKY